ncbi:hypothetical protein [Lysobacter sp. CA199]|uniref:hypothetical protein n=1 Tax=Lysobacter sp. CA199 TaxID=3455608 RepID=UPI003F8D76A4
MTERLIVRLHHLRGVRGFNEKPGFCVSKSREWFQRYDLTWREFAKDGIDAERLLATGDAMAAALVAHARQVEEAGDGQ